MQPGRSHDYRLCRRVDGTHIEQPSTNIDLERQTAHGARHSGRDQGNRPGCSRVRPGGPNATVEASGNQRIWSHGRGHETRGCGSARL